MDIMHQTDEKLVQKWGPVLEGIDSEYTRRVTAQLLENQAKAIVDEKINEDISTAATTTGRLGTFQKFAFPLVRRVYPSLIANSLVAVQPMQGPVSQVFYLGNSRASGTNEQVVYSKFNMTYRGLKPQRIGSASGTGAERDAANAAYGTMLDKDGNQIEPKTSGLDGDDAVNGFDVSNVLGFSGTNFQGAGAPSGTMGGQIAAFPNEKSLMGFQLSAGERLTGTGIPEVNFHIEQEAVVANTRKMRTLWTLEASQDLKAYHNLDLERELTDLLSKELALEIDRELIEDIRMIAYGFSGTDLRQGGVDLNRMDSDYISLGGGGTFPGTVDATTTGVFVPEQGTYDFDGAVGTATRKDLGAATKIGNVFVCDFSQSQISLYPRHVGEVYANLLATINLASQDIFTTTMRGPGSWLLTSPLVASLLESAAKLEGGIMPQDAPTNMGNNQIQFKGKFMGRYDLYIDPMFPTDEIIVGYKGANAMDAGMVYAPYIPLQQLPTVVDPESFQPRKGLLTRYGKVMIQPHNRFYRVIRIIGPTENYLFTPFAKNDALLGTSVS